MLRILVADGHEMIRRGVRALVEDYPGWMICAEASDGQQTLNLALRENPDIVILDVSLAILNGVAIARILQKDRPKIRVLFFAMHDDPETVIGAVAAGARGYVLKNDAEAELAAAISALHRDRPYFSSPVSELLLYAALNERQKSRMEGFTTRELEVAQLLAEGSGNKEIARALMISVKTVESHRAAAMHKAGVRTAAAFVRFAVKHKMIQA